MSAPENARKREAITKREHIAVRTSAGDHESIQFEHQDAISEMDNKHEDVDSISLPEIETSLRKDSQIVEIVQHGNYSETDFARINQIGPWLPEIDPGRKQHGGKQHKNKERYNLLYSCFICSIAIFITNLVTLCIMQFSPSYETDAEGLVSMHKGDCTSIRQINIALHFLINLLSSALLAASNVTMQLMAAPIRAEVDITHQKDTDYYDVGILSFRNLWKTPWRRKLVCVLLICSSLPLHFMYTSHLCRIGYLINNYYRFNSVISTEIAQFGFPIVVVTPSFLGGASMGNYFVDSQTELYVNGTWNPTRSNSTIGKSILQKMRETGSDPSRYVNISKLDCLKDYSNPFSGAANLFVVVEESAETSNASLLEYNYFSSGGDGGNVWASQMWICAQSWQAQKGGPYSNLSEIDLNNPDCHNKDFSQDRVDHWQKYGHRVQYCLSLRNVAELCGLNFSPLLGLGKYSPAYIIL
jgi:hypothetical protein